jgi:ABC-type microcin C transport system permease subunit YejB
MFLLTAATEINPNTAALVGYIVMALALVLAAIIVVAIVKRVVAIVKKAPSDPVAEAVAQTAPIVNNEDGQPLAPGSAGQVKLHDGEPKTAAMLMAIVADKTGKPLNELRFISIKEVK